MDSIYLDNLLDLVDRAIGEVRFNPANDERITSSDFVKQIDPPPLTISARQLLAQSTLKVDQFKSEFPLCYRDIRKVKMRASPFVSYKPKPEFKDSSNCRSRYVAKVDVVPRTPDETDYRSSRRRGDLERLTAVLKGGGGAANRDPLLISQRRRRATKGIWWLNLDIDWRPEDEHRHLVDECWQVVTCIGPYVGGDGDDREAIIDFLHAQVDSMHMSIQRGIGQVRRIEEALVKLSVNREEHREKMTQLVDKFTSELFRHGELECGPNCPAVVRREAKWMAEIQLQFLCHFVQPFKEFLFEQEDLD